MCMSIGGGNKVEVCRVGDLKPGQRYRTPDGKTMVVLNETSLGLVGLTYTGEGDLVMDQETGEVFEVPSSTKLGHDRRDRLYASRYLNDTTTGAGQSALIDVLETDANTGNS